MKTRALVLIVGLLFIGFNVYAADGDLIVNGRMGIGMTTGPVAPLHIVGTDDASPGIFVDAYGTTHPLRHSNINFRKAQGTQASPTSIVAGSTLGELLSSGWITNHDGSSGTWSSVSVMKWWASENWYSDYPIGGGYYINFYTRPPGATGYGTERLRITDSGNVGIGTTDPGGYRLYVAGDAYATGTWQSSDIRFKENILPIVSSLDKVLSMEGITFDWKRDEFKDKGFPEGRHYGVIAQEIEKVLPEVVKEGPGGGKNVSYTEIIPVLIEAIKEQQKIIGKQQKEIEELREATEQLKLSIHKTLASSQP